jgi:hypothetical protein
VKYKFPCLLLIFFAFASLTSLAVEKKSRSETAAKPPVVSGPCPDISVANMRATLVSTLLGDLQVEVPMDTVKLEATLENAGSEEVPPGAYLYLIVKKNGAVIQTANAADTLAAPGSRWIYSVNDSFPHGRKTTYTIQAASALKECRVGNNQATVTIDEKKLHPAGNPDLTVSIFAVEKGWRQEGERTQAFFDLAVDVANRGSGSSNSSSRLLFIQNDDRVLATLDIPQEELPGPGQKRRFTTQLTAAQVPLGDVLVSAHIEPARNEYACNNNWSLNSGQLSNSADPAARVLAVLDFQPWRLSRKTVSAVIQAANLQKRPLLNLRLLLLKNNVPVREWKALRFGPQESRFFRYAEERQPPAAGFGIDRFRAVLTSDAEHTPPAAGTVLDTRTRNLYWVKLGEGGLQGNLLDKDNGLAALVVRQNQSFLVREASARITAAAIRVSVKGRKSGDQAPDMEFQTDFHLLPRMVFGQVKVEVSKTTIHLGPGLSEFYSSLLAPILSQSIRAFIEKSAAKELARNLTALPPGLRSNYGSPLGIILANGALDVYY